MELLVLSQSIGIWSCNIVVFVHQYSIPSWSNWWSTW